MEVAAFLAIAVPSSTTGQAITVAGIQRASESNGRGVVAGSDCMQSLTDATAGGGHGKHHDSQLVGGIEGAAPPVRGAQRPQPRSLGQFDPRPGGRRRTRLIGEIPPRSRRRRRPGRRHRTAYSRLRPAAITGRAVILPDTNVLSELTCSRPAPQVVAWRSGGGGVRQAAADSESCGNSVQRASKARCTSVPSPRRSPASARSMVAKIRCLA